MDENQLLDQFVYAVMQNTQAEPPREVRPVFAPHDDEISAFLQAEQETKPINVPTGVNL